MTKCHARIFSTVCQRNFSFRLVSFDKVRSELGHIMRIHNCKIHHVSKIHIKYFTDSAISETFLTQAPIGTMYNEAKRSKNNAASGTLTEKSRP